MSTADIIFISYFSTLIVALFFLMAIKGFYHFEYLKDMYSGELNKYSNIFDPQRYRFYNEYAILMIIPTFVRIKKKDKSDNALNLEKTIEFYCRLIYIDLVVLIVSVVLAIVLFGE